jgi:CMP-N,N'-diacetyllegionaminic acid synthase
VSCLAVVTARGGSKGVPGKNVRPVGGRPLLEYTLDLARACPEITTCVVTTDSEEIRELALRLGAEAPFLRPAELATDTARQEDAVLHAMDWYEQRGETFDLVCLLEPTSPLRRSGSLARGFELLRSHPEAEAVFSVAECAVSPLYCRPLPPDGLMGGWIDDEYKWANRQELPAFYHPVGAVVLSRWAAFRRERTFLHERTLALVVDAVEAVDVDTPLDLVLVEALVERGVAGAGDLDADVREG